MSKASSLFSKKRIVPATLVVAVAVLAWWGWQRWSDHGPGEGFASGNGRIEATEIDVATKLPGRVEEILVREGDFVQAGQVLARMQVDTLNAQRDEARAQHAQALTAVATAQAQVAARESERRSALAQAAARESDLDAARRKLERSQALAAQGMWPQQELDNDRARVQSAQASVTAARAQATATQAAIDAARSQVAGARAAVAALEATQARIAADIADATLKAPRDGRVQFRVAQPGEVVAAGGKVLNMVDLSDVFMAFFVPETVAGRIAIGSEARIVLDAAPQFVIPARVSFVSATAQFTPKTVETASERQKLMFRVRARIAPELLRGHLEQVKTGLPGEAWIRLDTSREWPQHLTPKVR